MKNKVQEGHTLLYTNSSGSPILSGAVIPLAQRIAIACVDIANNASGSMDLEGVFTIAKTTGQAMAQGAELYYDPATSKVTSVQSGTTKYAGIAAEAKLSADTSIAVRLQSGNSLYVAP